MYDYYASQHDQMIIPRIVVIINSWLYLIAKILYKMLYEIF